MRTVVLALALLLLGVMPAAAAGVFPYAYETRTLDNGLKVFLIPMESPGVVAYYSIVRTGSRDEVEPGHSGFAHFFEHMMFRGTKSIPAAVYDSIVTDDRRRRERLHHRRLHLLPLDVRHRRPRQGDGDRERPFPEPVLRRGAFQTEAGAVYGEYRKIAPSPGSRWKRRCATRPSTTTPTSTPPWASRRTSRRCRRCTTTASHFWHRFYRPENVVLVIVGDFDKAKTWR